MIDSHSVNLNVIDKQEWLPLPKESCQISDDKVDQNNVSFVKKLICLNQVLWMILID